MLLGTLDASLLGNILTGRGAIAKRQGRGINRAGKGQEINSAGEGIVRAGYSRRSLNSSINKKDKKKKQHGFLMLPHPLTNFEIQTYY